MNDEFTRWALESGRAFWYPDDPASPLRQLFFYRHGGDGLREAFAAGQASPGDKRFHFVCICPGCVKAKS